MQDIKKLLGKRIKELRQAKGLTQEQLAELINIDQRSLSYIECGGSFPSKSLMDIAVALNISLSNLFDFDHLKINSEDMKKEIKVSLDELNDEKIKILYKLIKSMR